MNFIWILSPTLVYAIFVFIRLNFLKLRSFSSIKDVSISASLQSQTSYNSLYSYMLYGILGLSISSFWLFNTYNQITGIYVTLTLLAISIIFVVLQRNSQSQLLPIGLLFTLISLLLCTSVNLYQVYIILEILAYANLLFLTTYTLTSSQSSTTHHLTAMIINFILNFVASILLFAAIVLSCWQVGYPTFWSLEYFTTSNLFGNMLTVAILVKLGSGPWLAGNAYSYKGYNLPYLLIYTVVSIAIVLPTLLYVLSSIQTSLVIMFAVLSLLLFISQTIHKIISLKALFAYSTTILHSYILLILTL